jgi:phage terminase large subunit GpA-like protein
MEKMHRVWSAPAERSGDCGSSGSWMRLRVRNGVKSRVWQKTRARNEALDIRVYALAAFVNLNANLDALAKSLKAKTVDESKSEEQPRKDPLQAIMRPPRSTGFVNSWKT